MKNGKSFIRVLLAVIMLLCAVCLVACGQENAGDNGKGTYYLYENGQLDKSSFIKLDGGQWFKDRGQWIDNSATPSPGMIIFFDWNNKGSSGPQDGLSDHVGIVERVEDGIIYTIEGNSGDSCRENHYAVGHYEILGYGVPAH